MRGGTVAANHGHSPWVEMDLPFRIVLQNALSEVMKVYPLLKLRRVLVDKITAFMKGRNKELVEMAEKVLMAMKSEVEEKGLKLWITEGGKEGKSRVITSCEYLDEGFPEYSKEGIGLATSIETLGVDLRTRTKQLEAKEKARRKKCEVRLTLIRKNRVFQQRHEDWCEEVAEEGFGPCESVEGKQWASRLLRG